MDRDCPGPERLAEYADGVLGPDARAAMDRHLLTCPDCRDVLADTMAFHHANPAAAAPLAPTVVAFPSRRWVTGAIAGLAAAAALVLAVRIVRPAWVEGLFGPRTDRPELQELIAALANEPTRPVEGRLTGGFKYAPPPSPTRGPGDREPSPEVRIAAAKIEDSAKGQSARDFAALGIAHLAVGDLEQAVSLLERAASASPADASVQNDLAVAYLARGRGLNRPEDFEKARASVERALTIAPAMMEAAFNRALAYSELGLASETARAWEEFRRLDASSEWTRESMNRSETRRP